MSNLFTPLKFLAFILLTAFLPLEGFGQLSYLTTVPPYSGGNSSSLTTFNVKATRKIRVREVYNSFTSAASQTVTLWYKTDSLNGVPAVSTANGWIQAGVVTFTPTPTGAGNIALIPISGLNITIPAGATYAFAISTTGSITYTGTGTTSVSPWLMSDPNIYINMGGLVGYGGTIASPIAYRQFNGKLGYEIVPTGPDNAGAVSVTEPSNFCPGSYDVKAKIRNNGTNQITSLTVKWTVNNVLQTPVTFTSLLDTFGGAFASDTVLTLGNLTWVGNQIKSIRVWTEAPNSAVDTVNNDDTAYATLGAAMAGTFQIGGSTPDYPNLKAFADDVTSRGLCGPVTAIVNPGTYTGKAFFNSPGGASATNTITIQGTNKATCILSDSIVDPVLMVANCSYTTIRDITVTNKFSGACFGISLVGNNNNNNGTGSRIVNCNVNIPNCITSPGTGILVSGAQASLSNNKLDSINLDSNYVNGGYYGMVLYGNTGASSAQNRGHKIRANTVVNAYVYGIYDYYIYNPMDVLDNDITMHPSNSSTGYGLYHYYNQNSNTTTPTRIEGNILRNVQYMAMYIYYNASNAAAPHRIYNNAVIGNMNYSTNYGVYLYTAVAGTFHFMHNTIHYNGAAATQYGLYYYNSANVSGLVCKNNIFSIYSTSAGSTVYPAYFSSNPTGNVINYNAYYNSRNTTMGYRGAAFTTANFKTVTTGGDSSVNQLMNFVSNTDPRLADGCVKGTDLTSFVPTDKYGNTRSITPNPGMSEYQATALDISVDKIYNPVMPVTPGAQNMVVRVRNNGNSTVTSFDIAFKNNNGTPVSQTWTGTLNSCDTVLVTFTAANQITIVNGLNAIKIYTSNPNTSADNNPSNDTLAVNYTYIAPMSGLYTIGGTGADFAGIQEAFNALSIAGVSGAVRLEVNPGTYTGPFTLNAPVYGVSATNTITLDGLNPATRIVTANVGAPAIKINMVSYVTIKNLTVTNSFAGNCSGIALIGTASNQNGKCFQAISNNVNLPNVGTSTSYGIIVTGTATGLSDGNQWTDSVTIDSNTITGGYYGIQISTSGTGNALYNRGHKIRYNILNNIYYYGMRIYYIYNAVDIIGNKISMQTSNASSYGIYFYYNQNSNAAAPSRLIGNEINAGYCAVYYYYFTSPLGTKIPVYNNVFQTYGTTYATYFYTGATGGGEMNVYHNTFRTNGASTYGMYYYDVTTGTSNFKNNIFYASSPTTTPAYFNTNPTGNVINYNNYFNAGNGPLIYRGASYNASNFLSATVGGDSSYNVLPLFLTTTNARLQNGCTQGTDLTNIVSTDIDNNPRAIPPVIGAHEASSTLNDVALERVYVNGPVLPGSIDLVARVRNNKGASITGLDMFVQVNNGTPQNLYYPGQINGCDTAQISFTGSNQVTLPAGYNVVKVYTSNPGGTADQKNTNDTIYLVLSTVSTAPGNCFVGNGTGGRSIKFPHNAKHVTPNAFTVEAWVNLATPTANQKLVAKSSTTNGFVLGVQNGSIYPEVWTVANGTGSITLTAGTIPANTWTHLAMTWQSGVGLKAYINGIQVGAVANTTVTTNTPSTNDLTIGTNSWDNGHASTGMIDEVRIWNVALDTLTIRKNMHRMLYGTEAGLVSYVQMNEPASFTQVGDVASAATGNKLGTGIINTSTVVAGGDSSMFASAVTVGQMGIYGLNVNLVNSFANPCDVVALEVPYAPNAVPTANKTLNDRYWIINVFGTPGTGYSGDLTFTLPTNQINSADTSLSLYARSPYSTGGWNFIQKATASNFGAGSVTFYGVNTFGQFTLASNGNSPLPVKFINFTATPIGNDVQVSWTTASEQNNRGFAVERATNNMEFEEIGFVESKVINSSRTTEYSFTDAKADRSQSLFYRLRQIDLDGKYSYSPIAAVEPDLNGNAVKVFPNPFTNHLSLKGLDAGSEITITDLNGKVILKEMVKGNTAELNLPTDLKAGIYLLHTGSNQVIKLVRQ